MRVWRQFADHPGVKIWCSEIRAHVIQHWQRHVFNCLLNCLTLYGYMDPFPDLIVIYQRWEGPLFSFSGFVWPYVCNIFTPSIDRYGWGTLCGVEWTFAALASQLVAALPPRVTLEYCWFKQEKRDFLIYGWRIFSSKTNEIVSFGSGDNFQTRQRDYLV